MENLPSRRPVKSTYTLHANLPSESARERHARLFSSTASYADNSSMIKRQLCLNRKAKSGKWKMDRKLQILSFSRFPLSVFRFPFSAYKVPTLFQRCSSGCTGCYENAYRCEESFLHSPSLRSLARPSTFMSFRPYAQKQIGNRYSKFVERATTVLTGVTTNAEHGSFTST